MNPRKTDLRAALTKYVAQTDEVAEHLAKLSLDPASRFQLQSALCFAQVADELRAILAGKDPITDARFEDAERRVYGFIGREPPR